MTPPAEGLEKDVLLVLDKQQGKVSAVKGIDKDGNLQTVPPTAAHGGEFMQVDRNGDIFSNLVSNFYRKYQDTAGLELFNVRVSEAEKTADFMYYYSTDIHINMLHVAVFVTVFSTLGAVIDTALSVTSSVYEVWTHKNSLTAKELTSSGYQVGKEIIGTTVNTLLFAYLGGSILLFAYVQTQQYNLEIILNSKFLFQDVAIMLSGAIACLFTVPVSIRCVIRQIHHAASETDHS